MNLAESARAETNIYDEHSLHVLADCLPQLIWTCDCDGRCDFVSRHGREYTGLDSVNGQVCWLPLVHVDDGKTLLASWRAAQSCTEPLRIKLRLKRFDGVYRFFDVQLARVTARGEQNGKWLVSATDVQDSVDARNELLSGHQHLREVFDRAPVAITLEDWRFVIAEIERLKLAAVDVASYLNSQPRFIDDLLDSIKILDANDATLKLLKASSRQQLVGNSISCLFTTPEARAEFVNVFSVLATGQHPTDQPRMLCALDGTPLLILVSSVERAPETSPGLVLVSRVDVTEHYRNQEEVRRQRNMLEQVGRLAKVGGWMRDMINEKNYFTAEFARIHGLSEDDSATVLKTFEMFTPEDQEFIAAGIEKAAMDGQSFTFEREIVTADQQHKWLRAKILPIVDNGKLVRVEGAVQDITDRKHAELEIKSLNACLETLVAERTRQLELARHDLQNILDALPSMVVSFDTELRLRFANRSYLNMVGLDAESALGMHADALITSDVLYERLPRLRLALQGQPQDFEGWLVGLDGAAFRAKTYYQPDIVDGVVRGVYALIIDITKLTQAEDGLRAANRELEAFAYAVAHDLRSPLRAMSGFSSALLEDYAKVLPDEARDFAVEINKGSRRMAELLDGLLSLSRSTQGVIHFNRVDLSAMAQALLEELQRQEPQRLVSWHIEPELIAFGDARMLELVMRNLLGNAWKYTSRTAQAMIRVDQVMQGGSKKFRVIDNGAGFDMAHAGQLFKPFQRLHRQEEFIGIGIGLATANRIINRHGGVITAEGAPGHGAIFCFSLGGQSSEGSV